MNVKTLAKTTPAAGLAAGVVPAVFAALLGLGIMFVSGHAQANALHDAAHDVRHATGFPCH